MNLFQKSLSINFVLRSQLRYPFYRLNNGIPTSGFASFKDKLQKKQKETSEQEFRKEMDFLMNKPSFTLADYKQRVIDGLDKMRKGIKAKLMSGNEDSDAALSQQKKILNAMKDDELLDETIIKWKQKLDISIVSQTKVQDVNILLKKFDQMKAMHTWLRNVKERGEPAPKNQEELGYRFRKDKPISKSFLKFKMDRPRYNKKQIRQRIKWGPRKRL